MITTVLPVHHDIKHRDEPETDVTEVGRQGLEVLLLSESIRGELLRELGVDLQVLLVPVVQQVVVGGHDAAELIHSDRATLVYIIIVNISQ